MTLCIKNARHLEAPVDLLVDGDRILTMTPAGHHAAPEGCEIFDAHGLALMPSFIDAHVHLREPGFEYKKTLPPVWKRRPTAVSARSCAWPTPSRSTTRRP